MCFVLSMVLVALVSNNFKDMFAMEFVSRKCMQMLERPPGVNIHWLPKRGQWNSLPTMLVYLDCQCLQHCVGEPTEPHLPNLLLYFSERLMSVRVARDWEMKCVMPAQNRTNFKLRLSSSHMLSSLSPNRISTSHAIQEQKPSQTHLSTSHLTSRETLAYPCTVARPGILQSSISSKRHWNY